MSYKITHMLIRSLILSIWVICFFFTSEYTDLTRIDIFIMLGSCGGYAIVTLGLLLESGLQVDSNKFLEALYSIGGTLVSLLCALLSLSDYFHVSNKYKKVQTMSTSMIFVLNIVFYIGDVILLFLH